jgi:tRNA pseudouridine55 synthase
MSARVFNVHKPASMTSYDVIRHFKRHLPRPFGKIGHFGTLDPFATGVLLIAIGGASKINNFVHDWLEKSYLATGILGVSTPTGDLSVPICKKDESEYLKKTISSFSANFIEERLREEFLGEYWQAPHHFSAAKIDGVPLHKWARKGVMIDRPPVKRFVYDIRVVDYTFPRLGVSFVVSSGTYIRTLFSDCAHYLGTLGVLEGLQRTAIGHISLSEALTEERWPGNDEQFSTIAQSMAIDEVLPLNRLTLSPTDEKRYLSGVLIDRERISTTNIDRPVDDKNHWVCTQSDEILGMARFDGELLKTLFNLPRG